MQPIPNRKTLRAAGVSRVRAELAVQLGTLRVAEKWSWTDLANKANLRLIQVQEIEAGGRDPAFSTLVKLAVALRLRSLDELLGPLPFAHVTSI